MNKRYIQSILWFLLFVPFCHAQEKTSPPPLNCDDCRSEKPNRFRIVIDPGHGGIDTGAQAEGVSEKDITLAISLLLGKELQKRGCDIVFTRTDDRFVSLSNRARLVNRTKPDLFISIHVNSVYSPSAHGFEIWIRKGGDPESENLAHCIRRNLVPAIPSIDRGVKNNKSLQVLSQTHCPAGLVELGFITHKIERSRLIHPKWQKTYAEAIAKGVKNFLDSKSAGKKNSELRKITLNRRFKKRSKPFPGLKK